MAAVDKSLLERVARSINHPDSGISTFARGSILKQAARSYGARPILEESTVPTGFDPQAAVLFEAVIEAAFLVAASDGKFDADERVVFESIVVEACDGIVDRAQIDVLVTDFADLLHEDGVEQRTKMVARAILRPDHQSEVLRIAALMAHMSEGVSAPERGVLELLAKRFDLSSEAVDKAIESANAALGSAP